MEVVEGACVAIAGLPGEPVGQLEVRGRLILFEVRGLGRSAACSGSRRAASA